MGQGEVEVSVNTTQSFFSSSIVIISLNTAFVVKFGRGIAYVE